jgi:membrane-bound serine protease (ClpP class)
MLLAISPGVVEGARSLAIAAPAPQAAFGSGPIYTVAVQGPVTNATIAYLRRALQQASAAKANALILNLQSSGGVLREIRPLAAEIVAADVPVVVFIAPSGTQSGAAGAFFASAAHFSAMAPNTSFGSPYPLVQVDQALSPGTQTLISDSVADQLRDWNRSRGRSVAWVEQAVQSGVILTNQQAMATNPPAIQLVAANTEQLLSLLDGQVVTLANGAAVQLRTLGAQPQPIPPTLAETFWQVLAEPNVVFALLVLGALAIMLEFAAPGTSIFAGIGIAMLIAALIGLFALPFSGWAFGLIILGLVLVGLEFVVTSHGGLTIAGFVALAVGGLNLIDPLQAPGAGVDPWAVMIVVVILAGLIVAGFGLAMQVRRKPAATGAESLVGRIAEVRQPLNPQGMVFLEGALWQAVSESGTVDVGDWVRVESVHKLRLIVRPIENDPK